MKILISSPTFLPVVGGHVQAVDLLACGLSAQGHEVRVLCQQAGDHEDRPYRIIRRPGLGATIKAGRWADVVLHANVSLRSLAPLLITGRPAVFWHHGWYFEWGRRPTLASRIKLFVTRFGANMACSQAVADYIGPSCAVVSGPYDNATFKPQAVATRDRDLLFVGRLVRDKGADLLIAAVARLQSQGVHLRVTITGSGPEEPALRQQVHDAGLDQQIQFTGTVRGHELAALMHRHRCLAIPSRWHEPFGLVTLEGIACGCRIVGSAGGGLSEAIGPCGVTFPNEDTAALASRLQEMLAPSPPEDAEFARVAAAHLARFTPEAAAEAALKVLRRAAGR